MNDRHGSKPKGWWKIPILAGASLVLKCLRYALFAVVLAIFAASLLAQRKDLAKYPHLQRFVASETALELPAQKLLRSSIPTKWDGKDISRWILGIGTFLLGTILGNIGMSFSYRAERLKVRQAETDEESAELLGKLDKLQKGKLTRAELLEIMAQTKKTLEKTKQHLAFLSIDVVNSTGMKVGEDSGVAERDFKHYKALVDGILKDNKAFKAAWTPDGVMICFMETRQAVLAAQQIIKGLARFNKEVKAIRMDFAIRAGINDGDLLTEDSIPMEEMTDRVIDIAGHMQKHGGVNSVCISEHAIKPLLKEFKFASAGREVDGCPVYEWKP